MAFLKSCGCELCSKIDEAIAKKILKEEEVSEMAMHIVALSHPEPDNIVRHCAGCHAEIDAKRAERRESLGLPAFCPTCAESSTKEYVGASIGGDLVKTRDPISVKYIEKHLKGSHAIQG